MVTRNLGRDETVESPRGFLAFTMADALHFYIQAAKKGHSLAQRELTRNWHPRILQALANRHPESAADLKEMKEAWIKRSGASSSDESH
jgi:hypothetical protein